MRAVITKSLHRDVVVYLMNRCVFFALNQIAWLVQCNILPDWVGFWDKKCCRAIIYLSQKDLFISYCKLIWPRITQSFSILLNMIKTIFLTSTISFFLSDESPLRLAPPFVFSIHISLFVHVLISKLSHLITLLIILNLVRILDFYIIILTDKNCTSKEGMSVMSICLTVHSSSKNWKPPQFRHVMRNLKS